MVDGVRSREDDVISGVPQGTVLGPLLFLIYISDLPSVLDPSTAVRLFADDCVVYRSIKSRDDQLQLQRDLDALHTWGRCWGMKFNTKKCNIMHMGKITHSYFYSLGGDVLSEVIEATYLGLTMSQDMSWSSHIKSLASRAHQRLGYVRRNLRGSPFRCRELAYKSLVRSIMETCSAVWDPTEVGETDSLERVQSKAARWARAKYGEASVTALRKELGWRKLADRRSDSRLILLFKSLHNIIAVPPASISVKRSNRTARCGINPVQLERPKASWRWSPLWKSPVYRTIQDWNKLKLPVPVPAPVGAEVDPALAPESAEADVLTIFKRQLASRHP